MNLSDANMQELFELRQKQIELQEDYIRFLQNCLKQRENWFISTTDDDSDELFDED